MIKILYIYDFEDWALHNVGRYWAGLIKDYARFTFSQLGHHEKFNPCDFDFILWGCSYMAERYLTRLIYSIFPRHAPLWNHSLNKHFITIIHDPCEIFPEKRNWYMCKPRRLDKIRTFAKIGVISKEMHNIMREIGFECSIINTNSTLPLQDLEKLTLEPLKIFSRARNRPRKNLNLFKSLQATLQSSCSVFNGYFENNLLPIDEYIQLIDSHNCYICTSWQEGGPLPLMDAMRRGCVVLTTPVGQTDELIQDGVTGYFCNNYDEFKKRIVWLSTHPDILLKMRKQALLAVSKRSDLRVRKQLIDFLNTDVLL